jgi:hypothetical protein
MAYGYRRRARRAMVDGAARCCKAREGGPSVAPAVTPAADGDCCTKPSTRTWAALAVMVAEGAGSAEAGQVGPRASDDLRLLRPRP